MFEIAALTLFVWYFWWEKVQMMLDGEYEAVDLTVWAAPFLYRLSHIPVGVDPSHGTGYTYLVEPVAVAAVTIGADGLIVEVHDDPAHAKCDGAQSQTPAEFQHTMKKVTAIRGLLSTMEG